MRFYLNSRNWRLKPHNPPISKHTNKKSCLIFLTSESVLALSMVDCGFDTWSGQTKDNKIDICCFSAKHTALRSKRMVGSESG
jgi:hypothetical protein